MQALWDKKSTKYARPEDDITPEELFWQKGAIHAEFGRVVCISCGYLRFDEDGIPSITTKSYYGTDEKDILTEFSVMLNKFTAKPGKKVCAHNGKEFDFPYLGRRYIINQLPIPYILQVQGKKPWETPYIDTMQLWKFGDYKSYTSLDLLTAILDIPTSKDDIDGSMVSTVYWRDKDPERIMQYCEKDVLASAQVLLRMCGMPLVPGEGAPESEEDVVG
jgi:DNA polymerase elongation subunit (family B)